MDSIASASRERYERPLDPQTYRLQGDTSIGLSASVLPAKSPVLKQKPIGPDEIGHLGEAAASASIDKALYAALAPSQPWLDREALVHDAVTTAASSSSCAPAFARSSTPLCSAPRRPRTAAEILPSRIARRLAELRVSDAAREHRDGPFHRSR